MQIREPQELLYDDDVYLGWEVFLLLDSRQRVFGLDLICSTAADPIGLIGELKMKGYQISIFEANAWRIVPDYERQFDFTPRQLRFTRKGQDVTMELYRIMEGYGFAVPWWPEWERLLGNRKELI